MKLMEILQECNVEYREYGTHHHCTLGWVNVDCPWCDPGGKSFRMGINTISLACNCYACGRHRPYDTLRELTGHNFSKIRELLKDFQAEENVERKKRGKLRIPKSLKGLTVKHRNYLIRRGFQSMELEKIWGLQSIGINPKLSHRIFIPIFYQGEMVSWTTRSTIDEGQRYISAEPDEEAISHKELLYGEDYCRHTVIVCEGPTDVWRIGPGAVATFGTTYTEAQLSRIANYPMRVICYDNEREAQRQANNLCDKLICFPGSTVNVRMETGKDPGSAKKEEIQKLRERFLLKGELL